MKIAILLLCHKNAEQINLLLKQLEHPQIYVFIHVDRKSSIISQINTNSHVFLLPEGERIDCKWGSISLVHATLHLIQYAYKKDKFDYFWLCSGQDFPIKSMDDILAFFNNHPGIEFLDLFPSKNTTGKSTNYDKRMDLYYPNCLLNFSFISRVYKRIYTEITGGYNRTWFAKRKNTTNLQFYFGSQWWCLSALAIEWILNYTNTHSELLQFYEHAIVPDESFFHTLLMNSPYAKKRHPALHYIDWSAGGNNPKTFTLDDWPLLQKSDKLMARKFDWLIDAQILIRLKQNIRRKN